MDELDFGPRMQVLADRERKFVVEYLRNGGNGRQAAIDAGYSNAADGAKVQAHRMLHNNRVLDALDEHGRRAFRSLLAPTLAAAKAILDAPDHPGHERMVQSLLSRLGYGERAAVDVHVSGEVILNHTDAAIADLRQMLALGIPEEKLEEIFGHSGLGRYRRMLEEQDRKSGRLIEARAEPAVPGMIKDKPVSIG
jgi:hypothetical protein